MDDYRSEGTKVVKDCERLYGRTARDVKAVYRSRYLDEEGRNRVE